MEAGLLGKRSSWAATHVTTAAAQVDRFPEDIALVDVIKALDKRTAVFMDSRATKIQCVVRGVKGRSRYAIILAAHLHELGRVKREKAAIKMEALARRGSSPELAPRSRELPPEIRCSRSA